MQSFETAEASNYYYSNYYYFLFYLFNNNFFGKILIAKESKS